MESNILNLILLILMNFISVLVIDLTLPLFITLAGKGVNSFYPLPNQ